MKVLVTGANGFIGKNLCLFLSEIATIEILKFDQENSNKELNEMLGNADFIVHLAGTNRPQSIDEFYRGNTDLTKRIIDTLNAKDLKTPLIFASSIQAGLNNDYGKSKKMAEDYIVDNYPPGIIFRLHNVFGKYCRPNYNSVVATFCHNIVHGKNIKIDKYDAPIELVYIDDICKIFAEIIMGKRKTKEKYNYIEPVTKTTVGHIANLIYSFQDNFKKVLVPNTGNIFVKNLFATFVSYCEVNDIVSELEVHKDERGNFIELVKTNDSGQISVSTSKPGVVRGNHYHNTKMEKFVVIKGEAKISMRKYDEKKVYTFIVSGKNPQSITIPVGYTHNIENIGDGDMVLMIWCNEIFDNNNPDTYYMEV